MTGQTIKCQYADLGATVLHRDPASISHSISSMKEEKGSLAAFVNPMPRAQCCSLFSHYD